MSKQSNPGRLCASPNCSNEAKSRGKYCGSCRKRKSRSNQSELKTVYEHRRDSARRRGIEFSLTLQEFEKFCRDTGYLKKRGRGKQDMTIDRKKIALGYAIDNIQMLSNADNVKKYYAVDIKQQHQSTKEEWGTPF